MLYSIKNREDSDKLEELRSLQNQVKGLRLQDKFGKQKFHAAMEKVFEPMSDIVKDASKDITKTITETSLENNITLDKLNEKV